MKISITIALFLAPSIQGVSIRNVAKSRAKFPVMPSGDSITKVMSGALEMGKGALSNAMYSEHDHCGPWGPDGEEVCEKDRDGLRTVLEDINGTLKGAFHAAGVEDV